MDAISQHSLPVPGASLYYKVRGAGPILLIIAGGGGDADSSDRFAGLLAGRYTVVTYDRRGYPRSPLVDPDQVIKIETHSEDAAHLLAALSPVPACVLGSSIGALIGLDLAIRHPEQVRVLVAHEPPVTQLLPRGEQPLNLLELYREVGAEAAIEKFAASIGVSRANNAGNAGQPPRRAGASAGNHESFFKYDARAVAGYSLDVAALRATPTRIVLAGGSEGREYFPYRCAARLAECLGTSLVEFPGNHSAFAGYPVEFAEKLVEVDFSAGVAHPGEASKSAPGRHTPEK